MYENVIWSLHSQYITSHWKKPDTPKADLDMSTPTMIKFYTCKICCKFHLSNYDWMFLQCNSVWIHIASTSLTPLVASDSKYGDHCGQYFFATTRVLQSTGTPRCHKRSRKTEEESYVGLAISTLIKYVSKCFVYFCK